MLKEGWVLVPNFQNRVLLGISTFVGMLLLVGWVAVNEPARMDVFTLQHRGRSIEAGAAIFINNCASCHGQDARGIAGKAPGLDNPMLFLRENPAKVANDKLSALKAQQDTLNSQVKAYNDDVQALALAQSKLQAAAAGSEEENQLKALIDQINGRLKTIDLPGTQKQLDTMKPDVDAAQAELDKLKEQGWDPTRDVRLNELKWAGRLEDYISSTVVSGRPASTGLWPGGTMPPWGQQAGGPLRYDEVLDVMTYIMNFRDGALMLTPKDVHQQFKLPGEGGPPVQAIGAAAAADVKALVTAGLTGGDAVAGEALYTRFACAGCHLAGTLAPPTAGTFTRVVDIRLKENAGKWDTPEEYLADSILHPNVYLVAPFAGSLMPQNFAEQLDLQMLKDLIAYLENQK